MSYETTGLLHSKSAIMIVSDRFQKREFVIKVADGAHEQFIKFELHQDKVSLTDGLKKGDEITVRFNIRGKEYIKDGEARYFTNLVAWKIEHGPAAQPSGFPTVGDEPVSQIDDDLPF